MSLRAFRCGCNVIAYEKDNRKYGMVCAWATMVDYDHIGMLIGSQSVTGRNLKIGDIVGVSALAEGQTDISLKLGETHSDECDKFEGIETINMNGSIVIKDAKVEMLCEVRKVEKLTGSDDVFVVMQVLSSRHNKRKEFLSLEKVYPED